MNREWHKIQISAIKEIIIYIPILILILQSKTAYFGIGMRSTFQWVFYASCVITFLVGKGSIAKFKVNLWNLLPFIFIVLLLAVLRYDDLSSDGMNTFIGLIFTMFSSTFLASSVSSKKFQKCYINIMFIICLISIPCFLIAVFRPDIAKSLAVTPMTYTNMYEYSWFYTWGRRGSVVPRNHGPFWEPGAFQGFIIIGIICMLNLDRIGYQIEHKKLKFIIFFITLLTTMSTTGYILCIFILIFFFKDICTLISDDPRYKKIVYLLIGVLSVATIIYIILSNNISDKFNGTYTQSAAVRTNDIVESIKVMFTANGLIGYGITNAKSSIEAQHNIINNSVGLFGMAYTYGFTFFAYYLITLWRRIKNNFWGINGILLVFTYVVLLVLHLTEGLWNLPVYLMLLMYFKEKGELYYG